MGGSEAQESTAGRGRDGDDANDLQITTSTLEKVEVGCNDERCEEQCVVVQPANDVKDNGISDDVVALRRLMRRSLHVFSSTFMSKAYDH